MTNKKTRRPVAKKTKATAARKRAGALVSRARSKVAHARKKVSRVRKPAASQIFWSTGLLGAVVVVAAVAWGLRHGHHQVVATNTASQTTEAQQVTTVHASPALGRAFGEISKLPIDQRMIEWSGWLARDPNALQELRSLGSGPATQDIAPLIPDGFDCTTFVETVAALARSGHPENFFDRLIEIRYRGAQPTYLSRNHFPEADWIPNNVAAGNLRDVTESWAHSAGVETASVEKTIDRGKWLAEQKSSSEEVSRSLASVGAVDPAWTKPQKVTVVYVPAGHLLAAADKLPTGVIVNFVRKNTNDRPVLITHQGFIIREKGKVWLRHASSGGGLRTVALGAYLRKNKGFVGVTLDQVNDRAM